MPAVRSALCLALLFAPAPAVAQRLVPGGELAVGVGGLWRQAPTGDGLAMNLVPRLRALVGQLVVADYGAGLDLGYTTVGDDDGEGTVSVKGRRHLLSLAPRLWRAWPNALAWLHAGALVEIAGSTLALEGSSSRSATGMRVGLAWAVGLTGRFTSLSFGMEAGGFAHGGNHDLFVALTAGWLWGGLATPDPDQLDEDEDAP